MRKLFLMPLLLCLVLSCKRASVEKPAPAPVPAAAVRPGARPLAILQTGEYPLWFQLTEDGPVHIESIEDAINTAAFIPWPLALHVRFFLEGEQELFLAINRDGFMKLVPYDIGAGIAVYRFTGGEFWRQYTIGGFVFYDDKPTAVLYLDDRFLDTTAPLPRPGTWTFSMESNIPFSLDIPALRPFPAEEGWSVDALRPGGDGFIYYRAVNKSGPQPSIKMFRTADLNQAGEEISLDIFYGSIPRAEEISHPLLPPLPEGFVYTGIGFVGDSLFASWEEQENFYIGASGFTVIKR